jgi:hypothetical protein
VEKSAALTGESCLNSLSCDKQRSPMSWRRKNMEMVKRRPGPRVIIGKSKGLNDTNIDKMPISRMPLADKYLSPQPYLHRINATRMPPYSICPPPGPAVNMLLSAYWTSGPAWICTPFTGKPTISPELTPA